jgi:hypothetical protein
MTNHTQGKWKQSGVHVHSEDNRFDAFCQPEVLSVKIEQAISNAEGK